MTRFIGCQHIPRRSSLKTLNSKFGVPTVRKPPPLHISTTLVAAKMAENVTSRNGPQTIQTQISLQDGVKIPRCVRLSFIVNHGSLWPYYRDTVRQICSSLDPDGAELRFPGRRRQVKVRGQLKDTSVYRELHFDGHEKLGHKGLQMGPVGIDVYGARCHSSGKIIEFRVLPNARCSSTIGHFYLDLVSEHGGESPSMWKCLPLTLPC